MGRAKQYSRCLVGGLMPKPVAAQDAKPLDAAATAKIKSEVSDALAS